MLEMSQHLRSGGEDLRPGAAFSKGGIGEALILDSLGNAARAGIEIVSPCPPDAVAGRQDHRLDPDLAQRQELGQPGDADADDDHGRRR